MTVPANSRLEHSILQSMSQIDAHNDLADFVAIGDMEPEDFKPLNRSFTVHFQNDPSFTIEIEHSAVGNEFITESKLAPRLAEIIARRFLIWSDTI